MNLVQRMNAAPRCSAMSKRSRRQCRAPAVRGWPDWVLALSRQTLFVYVFHVLLVYGDHVGLGSLIGPTLSPMRALGVALAVLVLSFAAALGHARWRERPRTRPCPDDSDGLIAGPWPNPNARDCPPT